MPRRRTTTARPGLATLQLRPGIYAKRGRGHAAGTPQVSCGRDSHRADIATASSSETEAACTAPAAVRMDLIWARKLDHAGRQGHSLSEESMRLLKYRIDFGRGCAACVSQVRA